MPHCEFYCHGCKQPFLEVLEQAEYETGSITCPHCGSRRVEQQVSPFYAVTSEKGQTQSEDSGRGTNSSASEEDDRARVLSDWEGEGGASGAEKVESVEQKLEKSVKRK